jgi:ribosomal protein L40E
MPQETLGYVELEWTCQYCGSKNPGTVKVCANCGAAMAKDQKFEAPAQQQLIKDEQKIAQIKKGADIHCPACGTRNPADAVKCSQCGSDLAAGVRRESGQVLGAFQDRPVAEVKCAACGTMNPGTASNCKNCNAPLGQTQPGAAPLPSFSVSGAAAQPAAPAQPEPHPPPVAPQAQRSGEKAPYGQARRVSPVMLIIGGLVALLCLCGLGFFIFASLNTSDTAASVQSVYWERIIGIEERGPVERKAWEDQIPSDAQVGRCELQVREVLDNPDPSRRSDKECGTPYVVDQGSGAGQVVQDCKYNIYDNYCEYTVLEWKEVDRVTANGTDLNPEWPSVSLQSGQREGERTEKYDVTFDAQGTIYHYSPSDATEFAQFQPGSDWTLRINMLGGVTDVLPAR